jgi:hypothetical protein
LLVESLLLIVGHRRLERSLLGTKGLCACLCLSAFGIKPSKPLLLLESLRDTRAIAMRRITHALASDVSPRFEASRAEQAV